MYLYDGIWYAAREDAEEQCRDDVTIDDIQEVLADYSGRTLYDCLIEAQGFFWTNVINEAEQRRIATYIIEC